VRNVLSDDSMSPLGFVGEFSAKDGAWDESKPPLGRVVASPMLAVGDMQGRPPSTDAASEDSMLPLDRVDAESAKTVAVSELDASFGQH